MRQRPRALSIVTRTHAVFARRPKAVEDPTKGSEGRPDRRLHVYRVIDSQPYQVSVVIVAGLGFLVDAYSVFALNIIIPMLSYVYWGDIHRMPQSARTALTCAALVGTLVGQITFGILADRFGRRRMYGFELLLIITATVGCTTASSGAYNSMSVVGWLVFWRLLMGIGIGADYPLSGVIASEFAPRRHRARMLATVFLMQPLGQLVAMLVSMVVIKVSSNYDDQCPTSFRSRNELEKSVQCVQIIDHAWRWVVGLGTIPALFAMTFRLIIPESPRYLMDVCGAVDKAFRKTARYFSTSSPDDASTQRMMEQGILPDHATGSLEQVVSDHPTRQVGTERNNRQTSIDVPPRETGSQEPVLQKTEVHLDDLSDDGLSQTSKRNWYQRLTSSEAFTYFVEQQNWQYLVGVSLAWLLIDIPFYGLGQSVSLVVPTIWNVPPSRTVHDYLFLLVEHDLVVVSAGSILGGIILVKLIEHASPRKIQFWSFLVLSLLFITTGSAFRHLGNGFVVLYILISVAINLGPNGTTFILPAILFPTKYRCTCHGIAAATGKLGSVIAQLVMAYAHFGNEDTLYDANARMDWTGPTQPPQSLGHVLQVFCGMMLLGAAITWFWIPETRDGMGKMRSLEVLAQGKLRLDELGRETAPEDRASVDEED